ncbi:MAG: hypothetical protein AAF628_37995 [Planctomycetota bacterium]
MSNKKPITTLRDGSLKATIWRNSGRKGDYLSARLTRSWRDDDGNWHDSDRLQRSELLAAAQLLTRAYDELARLQAEVRAEAQPNDGRQA